MAWFFGQSLIFVGLSVLLGVLIGWLIWGRRPAASGALTAGTVDDGTQAELQRLRARVAVCDNLHLASKENGTQAQIPDAEAEPIAAVPDAAEPLAPHTPDERDDISAPGEVEPVVAAPVAAEPVPPAAEGPLPVVAAPVEAEPLPPAADDLKRIEGIGPRMSAALQAAGISTFAALAQADLDTIRTAIENAGLRFAPSMDTWSRQARLLADGDEAGFAELTKRLVGGRDVSGNR